MSRRQSCFQTGLRAVFVCGTETRGTQETTGRSKDAAISYDGGGRYTVRCPHCGKENPGIHRFCGMCGKALEEETPFGEPATDAPPEETRAPAVLQPARPVAPEPPAPAPAYTGGLFNLGASGDTPSRNLDYLLEDDEPRSGKGLLLLAVVAVALVVGLGWLRFRHSGIPGLRSWGAHTAPAGQNEGGPASPVQPSANSEPNPP